MTRRNIMRFIISFIFGAFLFFKFGGEVYAAETHTCDHGVFEAVPLTSNPSFSSTSPNAFYLASDLDLTGTISISQDTTICLNGHVLKGNGSSPIFNIANRKTLTICDCQHDNADYTHKFSVNSTNTWELNDSGEKTVVGGVITNGYAALRDSGDYKGSINIASNSTLYLKNVNIVGNKSWRGAIYNSMGYLNIDNCRIQGNGVAGTSFSGGVYISLDSKSSTINNTIISDNVGGNGAGIYSANNLVMNDVSLLNNHSFDGDEGGGGIFIAARTTTINGSIIQGNTIARKYSGSPCGAGIKINAGGKLVLGGNITISNNINNTKDGKNDNVYLEDDECISISSEGLTTSTKIPLAVDENSVSDSRSFEVTEQITEELAKEYTEHFKSENEDYQLVYVYEDKKLELVVPYIIQPAGDSDAFNCYITTDRFNIFRGRRKLMGAAENSYIYVLPQARDGYIFDSISGSDGVNDIDIQPINLNGNNGYYFKMPAANVVLMPTFIKANGITFVANGGRGSMSKSYTADTTYTLPSCTFLPPLKKIFKGWSLSPNGKVETGKTINLTSDEITLYAIWEDHSSHTFSTVELTNGIIKESCKCGFYIFRYN